MKLVRRIAVSAAAVALLAPIAPAAFAAGNTSSVAAIANQRVLFDSLATISQHTGQVRATGRVSPTPPNGTAVYLQRWSPDGAWVGVATGRTSGGRVTVVGTRPGSVASYRLVAAPRTGYRAGISPTRQLNHYVWRGAFIKPVFGTATGAGGTFLVDRADRGRRTATFEAKNDAGIGSYLDVQGCLRIATSTTSRRPAGAATYVILDEDGGSPMSHGEIVLDGGQTATMNANLSNRIDLVYGVIDNTGDAKVTVTARIAVLCNN